VLPPGVGRLRVGINVAGQELTIDVDAGQCEISGAGRLTINATPRLR
jgi:hypothetical protein